MLIETNEATYCGAKGYSHLCPEVIWWNSFSAAEQVGIVIGLVVAGIVLVLLLLYILISCMDGRISEGKLFDDLCSGCMEEEQDNSRNGAQSLSPGNSRNIKDLERPSNEDDLSNTNKITIIINNEQYEATLKRTNPRTNDERFVEQES